MRKRSKGCRVKTCAKPGPKCKLSDRQKRQLVRCLKQLRKSESDFTCKRLMEAAGIEQAQVSVRTVTRFLNSKRYFYLQTRKKGLVTADDHTKRVEFSKYMKATYTRNVWTDQIGFYFVHLCQHFRLL